MNALFNLYKKAYSGLPREVWMISLIMLVNRSGTMVVPFMTIYLTSEKMGFSIGRAGLVMGVFGLGAILGGYMGGRLTDKVGHHHIQFYTLLGGGFLFILLGQVQSFGAICAVTFLLSLVNEAFRPANAASIALYSSAGNRTRSFSLNRLAVNLGWAVGGALGGLLASIDYSALFWVDGITNISAALLVRRLLKPSGKKISSSHGDEMILPNRSAYKDRIYIWFIVCTILFSICFFQMFSTLTAYFKNHVGFSSLYIGILMAVNGLVITFIEMLLVYKLEGRRSPTFYIVPGVMLVTMAYLLLNLVHMDHMLALLMILMITFGEIFAMPFMNSFWTSRSNDHNRGQYAGLYSMAWSVANTTGPMFGAQIAQEAGFRNLWWSIGGLGALTTLGFMGLHYWMERR